MITAQEYREFVRSMMHKDGKVMPIELICLGLAGEAAELYAEIQSSTLNPPQSDEEELAARDRAIKELGDVLWYKTAASISLFSEPYFFPPEALDLPPSLHHLVGKVCDDVKKHLWHGKDLDETATRKLLAAIDFNVRAVARFCGCSYDQVMQANVDKLRARYPAGFVEGGGIR